jgi:hypothetical protein
VPAVGFPKHPPKNWSGVFISYPQCVQLHWLPSASLPELVHTRMGWLIGQALPTVEDAEQLLEPLPL